MDLGTMYCDGQTRTMSLIGSLPQGAGSIIVAATPAWTVPDLVAHLCGVASDMVSGNLEDVASEAWTARQVALRRGRSLDEVLAEWTGVTGDPGPYHDLLSLFGPLPTEPVMEAGTPAAHRARRPPPRPGRTGKGDQRP